LTPGPRVAAHHGAWLVFRDGAFEGTVATPAEAVA